MTIQEETFRQTCYQALSTYQGKVKSVTGPGRSGVIAAVYASHFLGIPFIPLLSKKFLHPILIIDTAIYSGRTLRKTQRKIGAEYALAIFQEPPIIKFWYEYAK